MPTYVRPTDEKVKEESTSRFSDKKPSTDFAKKAVIQPNKLEKVKVDQVETKVAEKPLVLNFFFCLLVYKTLLFNMFDETFRKPKEEPKATPTPKAAEAVKKDAPTASPASTTSSTSKVTPAAAAFPKPATTSTTKPTESSKTVAPATKVASTTSKVEPSASPTPKAPTPTASRSTPDAAKKVIFFRSM